MEDRVNSLKKIIIILCFVFLIVLSIVIISTVSDQKLYDRDLCFSSQCIATFSKEVEGITSLIQAFGWFLITFVTIYGVIIALKTYYAGVQNNNNTNHTTHLTMFRDFANSELAKRNSISPDKVNIYKWYSIMFPDSRNGVFIASDSYIKIISEVRDVINQANSHITEVNKDYKYKVHQRNLILTFSKFGIILSNGPKNTFVEVESQLFEFVDVMNNSFSTMRIELSKVDRKYI
ncbi:retron Ec48 family effector membrane protein [Pantoea ananatis]|uniref:retron Ec48 family effector membrane protein n=1 Tax=Pantoea ananas TaxID=553 RepID=UPI003C2150B2